MSNSVTPHNLDAEKAVLGSILLDNNLVFELFDKVIPKDFYRASHQEIANIYHDLLLQNLPIDFVTVKEKILDDDIRKEFTEILKDEPDIENFEIHLKIIKDKSVLRRLISVGISIIEDSKSPGISVPDVLEKAENELFLASQSTHYKEFETPATVFTDVFEEMEILRNQEDNTGVIGVPTGLTELDRVFGGYRDGDLVVIAGRPSMGKSMYAQKLAVLNSYYLGKPTAFFSLEMSSRQIIKRMIANITKISHYKLDRGYYTKADVELLKKIEEKMQKTPLFIDDGAATTITEITSKVRRLKLKYPELNLIIVDYLQLVAGLSSATRDQEIGTMTRALKRLAGVLQIPIIVLSQLNRRVEERDDKRPRLSDLRESGNIEQDSDKVVGLYVKGVYTNKAEDYRTAEFLVLKHRNGPLGIIHADNLTDIMDFTDSGESHSIEKEEELPF